MIAIKGKVLIKVDVEQKNNYTFASGETIRLERDYQNLDKKYTSQSLGEVIDSEYIPKGALILFHHNAVHPVNEIFDCDYLTKEEEKAGFKVITLSENECFLWKLQGKDLTWNPLKNFCTALRVFKPYIGKLQGIEPTLIKNVLYLTSGEYKGKVVITLKATDYQITFRNEKGIDENFIRCRHYEDEYNDREELVGIDNNMTDEVNKGQLLAGITSEDCNIIKKAIEKLLLLN